MLLRIVTNIQAAGPSHITRLSPAVKYVVESARVKEAVSGNEAGNYESLDCYVEQPILL